MKTDTPETRALDHAAGLPVGAHHRLKFDTPEECAQFRYRLYNARRQLREWSKRVYSPEDEGYGTSPWDNVSIVRAAERELALCRRSTEDPEVINGRTS